MTNLPIIPLPGSEAWQRGFEWGNGLDAAFPNQDAEEFGMACQYVDEGPTKTQRIRKLEMINQGANDFEDWEWRVEFATGEVWQFVAGCDYTGWDCQAWGTWTKL